MYTKEIDENDRFKSVFRFQERGMILDDIYLNPDFDKLNMPFEIGDCIQVEVRKLNQ